MLGIVFATIFFAFRYAQSQVAAVRQVAARSEVSGRALRSEVQQVRYKPTLACGHGLPSTRSHLPARSRGYTSTTPLVCWTSWAVGWRC